ncbi:MAG: DUF3552 domain-containing protein, partial [Clostridia bacterium]|nr:DUF3552 domain-containing protein [Clostridia bacterium]
MTGIIIAIVATLAVACPSAFVIGVSHRKKQAMNDLESAENKAAKIIDDAKQDAERVKKDALIEAKDEAIKHKEEADKEIKQRKQEVEKAEQRVNQRQDLVD